MLHAIQESDSDENNSIGKAAQHISSGGSLSEFKSDDEIQRDISDDRHRESKELGRRVSQTMEDEGAAGLLALVRSERARMSSAVIGNADKLSSAVMAARKKLQGSIAAVEAAVRCERVEEEQQRHRVGTEADPLVGVPVEERGDAAKLRGRVIELEAKASSLEADRAAAESEREEMMREAHNMRNELAQIRVKASSLQDDNAALRAEVESLRERLGEQPYVLPSEEAAKKQGKEVRLSLPPSSPLPRPPAQASPRVPAIVSPNHAGGVQANPFSNVQRVEGVGRLVMEGVLRKKKSDHGMFEDPWRQKLQCSLHAQALVCESIIDGRPSGVKDVFPLTEWQVPPERRLPGSGSGGVGSVKTPSKSDSLRFDIISKAETKEAGWMSVSLVSFRAENASDCDKWVDAITKTRSALLVSTPALGFPQA